MILGNVEETITIVEYDEDTFEEHVKVILHCSEFEGQMLTNFLLDHSNRIFSELFLL